MTVQEVVLDLLHYIGVFGFAPLTNENALNQPGLDDLDVGKALTAVNQGLQELQKYGPASLREGERAYFFNDPAAVRVATDATATQSVTFLATPATWIPGCSILIEGDSDLNRVVDVTGNAVSLLRGYRGATGANVGAVVYADCAQLSDEVKAVQAPVIATPNIPLYPANSLRHFMEVTQDWAYQQLLGAVGQGYGTSKPLGQPRLYWVEPKGDGSLYLRLNPIPVTRTNVTFWANLRAQQVSVSALALDGAADPGIEFANMAPDNVESVLLPLARGKFLAHPSFKNAAVRAEISSAYRRVMDELRDGSGFIIRSEASRVRYI